MCASWPSPLRRRWRRAAATRAGLRWWRRRLLIEQHERGRRAFRVNGIGQRLDVARLDLDVADVDDARELAHPFEERAEVVIRAFELQADRPLCVQRLARNGLRG